MHRRKIRTYQKIINNRDQILAKANAEAEQIRNQAQQETAQLLNESDLVQSAYAQAEQIIAQARSQAETDFESGSAGERPGAYLCVVLYQ